MGVQLSKLKRSKSRRKKKGAGIAIECSDHSPFNPGSVDQVNVNDRLHDHNCFSITNGEDNDIGDTDNLTDDEKNDVNDNNYEDLDLDSLDDSLHTPTADAPNSPNDEIIWNDGDKENENEEELYEQLPMNEVQTQSASKKAKNTKQICSVCDSNPINEATLGYVTANDLQTLSKSIYSGYVRSSEFSEWASASAGKKTIKDERSRKLQTAEKPENQVPQMVEAFRPLIEECIRVNEVLPYLHFLADKDVIEAKKRESPKRAAGLLLDQIIASDELGKWTTFISALKTVGYTYVANTLLGATELDLTVQRNLLKVFIPELINNLQPSELIDHLYSRDVISISDKEEIECEMRNRGSSAASLMLLDRIPRRIHDWYNEFVGALRSCGFEFLADKIDIPEVSCKSSSSSSECSSAVFMADSQETQKKSIDNLYVTPCVSTRDMHSPTPPPIPKRPETTSHITDKHVFPYPVTPVPNWSKETMKQASHVDLINEKRRLTVELEDAKHKKMLKRDIKQLRKQIEQLENDESEDSDASSISDHVCDPFLNNATRKQKAKTERKDTLLSSKENDKLTNSFLQTDSFEETTDAKAELHSDDIKLKDITLNEFLNILVDRLQINAKQTVNGLRQQNYSDDGISTSIGVNNNIPIREIINLQPRAHTVLHVSASDSGMYSDSGYTLHPGYADAPSNYV